MEQLDLAKALGRKSASSISEWEKGKYTPKMKTLNEISKLFNVNIDDLMTKDLSSDQNPETIAAFRLFRFNRGGTKRGREILLIT